MHGVSLSLKDGEGHGERVFPFKEPRVTFRIDPNAAELEAQMQSDVCLSLLGHVGRRHHVPGQLCWQIHEGADSIQRDGPANCSESPGVLWNSATDPGLGHHLPSPLL